MLGKGQGSRNEIKGQIISLVKGAVRDRTGPSFESRLNDAVVAKTQVMKKVEKEQWGRIKECREKGEMRSVKSSPFTNAKPSLTNDEAQRRILIDRQNAMHKLARKHARTQKQMLERIRSREPLFRMSDVESAHRQLAEASEKRKKELQDDERKRWEHLEDINRSVLTRPLLMDL